MSGTAYHGSCHCGAVYPFHDGVANPGHYRLNLGCIPDIDLSSLAITPIDGASF
jgi:hypothetical protein